MDEYTEIDKVIPAETGVKTLRDTCEIIKEMLTKANGTAERIVGGSPSTARNFEESASMLEALANNLAIIQDMAESTLDYLNKIDNMI